MVTKQEQLEWLANRYEKWPVSGDYMQMSGYRIGWLGGCIYITKEEWQQERDKMSSKPGVDNSWHDRGELPPVDLPVELWVCGSFAYNCELISKRGNNYVLWNLDSDKADSADYMHSEFRPLRTEREKAIYEMVSVILDYDGYMITSATAELVARQLYDAGYRNVDDK